MVIGKKRPVKTWLIGLILTNLIGKKDLLSFMFSSRASQMSLRETRTGQDKLKTIKIGAFQDGSAVVLLCFYCVVSIVCVLLFLILLVYLLPDCAWLIKDQNIYQVVVSLWSLLGPVSHFIVLTTYLMSAASFGTFSVKPRAKVQAVRNPMRV